MSKRPAFVRPNRNSVTTIAADGSHVYLHPADVRGRFTLARRISAIFLIGLYLALPWIQINGHPAVFLDIADRRFHLFGVTLAFQDLWLLFFLITGLGFTLYFITSLLGRVWCGWACPQTVFLDHVFRRIERWVEGDAPTRRQLDAAPWTQAKVIRRVIKHALYILASLGITHLFLAYFVSLPTLWKMMHTDPVQNWSSFLFVFIAAGILYFNFAWFREQLCIVICPYGRLQSALIDDNSMVIGYDTARGEPRGKPSTNSLQPDAPKTGDCVDCARCVQVCPTGIDIRQGLQIECIGCAACIDACDSVMAKVGRLPGLIRYDSYNGLNQRPTSLLRPRTFIYAALLVVGAIVLTLALRSVKPASILLTRMTGAPYYADDTSIRNQFLLRLVNKTDQPARFTLTFPGAPEGFSSPDQNAVIELSPLGETVRPLIVQQARASYHGAFRLKLAVTGERSAQPLIAEAEFSGPSATPKP